MSNKLKPCPFCGGKVELREIAIVPSESREFTVSYKIRCPKCNIKFVFESRFRIEKGQQVITQNGYEKCVEAWNRRVEDVE